MMRHLHILLAVALSLSASTAHASRTVIEGSIDQWAVIRIIDSVTGLPEVSVDPNTAGIDLEYVRNDTGPIDIVEIAYTDPNDPHADGSLYNIGHGNYLVGLPDAALATGVEFAIVQGTVTDMIVLGETIQITSADLLETTASSVTSQTVLVLTSGSDVDDTYNGQAVVLTDVSNSNFPSVRNTVADYVGSSKTLTLARAPDFTIVSGDGVRIVLNPKTPITSRVLSSTRTWNVGAEGNTSEDIVKLNTWSSGTRRVSFDFTDALSPGTTIDSVQSATITKVSDSSTVTTSNLLLRQDKAGANFDIAAIATAATYEAEVQVTTSDDDVLNVSGTLRVE